MPSFKPDLISMGFDTIFMEREEKNSPRNLRVPSLWLPENISQLQVEISRYDAATFARLYADFFDQHAALITSENFQKLSADKKELIQFVKDALLWFRDAQVALSNLVEVTPTSPSEPAQDPLAKFFSAWLTALRRG